MESRTLDIVVHSAKDLYDVKHVGTMDPYAMLWVARVDGGVVLEPCKTEVAKKAGSCPEWDYPMKFQLYPMNKSYMLFCEVKHDGKLFDRKIGEVQVPFTDLLAGDGSRERVSYPVRTPSGEVKGEIIVSHKFSDGKLCRPRKKVQGKKKNGLIKKIATEAVLLVGAVGTTFAGDYIINGDGDGDGDADGDEDADEDEDEDEDADEY